jgi:hypothetical protein
MRTIDTKTADDGTELILKQRANGEYMVTEQGSDEPTGRIEPTRAKGRVNLAETARFYGTAESQS